MITHNLNKNLEDPEGEKDITGEIWERSVRTFLDLFFLRKLNEEYEPQSGYDFIKLVTDEFNITLSPGSIYAVLYSMEREGLIQGTSILRKRVYTLTKKGEEKLKIISEEKAKLLNLFERFFI